MAISLLSTPTYWILSAVICVLYPGYTTFAHLYCGALGWQEKNGNEDPRSNCGLLAHHIFYWAVYYVFFKLETSFMAFIVPFIPFFCELKLLVFFWLVSEHFKGAGYLFHHYAMKYVLQGSKAALREIDEKLDMRNKKTLMDLSKHLGSISEVTMDGMEA
ncbi:putative membrane protein [Babesia divergens]|uniref:Membrane protein n=1 Tax=Babesia divergens TaxID=32595 RepID=A0AAD9GAN8_BABDI|nr:putative membrane protein [Babesia divergens]